MLDFAEHSPPLSKSTFILEKIFIMAKNLVDVFMLLFINNKVRSIFA